MQEFNTCRTEKIENNEEEKEKLSKLEYEEFEKPVDLGKISKKLLISKFSKIMEKGTFLIV